MEVKEVKEDNRIKVVSGHSLLIHEGKKL